jgi:choline dehydrogenase-like flavoprotein
VAPRRVTGHLRYGGATGTVLHTNRAGASRTPFPSYDSSSTTSTSGTRSNTVATASGAVVDHAGRVHGLRRLRVADASIMPEIVSANTNATTIMIGEKIASAMLTATDAPAVTAVTSPGV